MCYWGNVALRNIIPFFTKTIITFPMLQLLQQGVWERGQCLALQPLHYHNFSSGDFCTVKVGSYWAEKEQFRHCAIFHTISLYFLGKAINVLFLPSINQLSEMKEWLSLFCLKLKVKLTFISVYIFPLHSLVTLWTVLSTHTRSCNLIQSSDFLQKKVE